MPELELQIVLALIALFAGVGITAIGPGGIFLTIALYALLPIAPPVVAGTASATFVATGVFGTAMYWRSGELGGAESRALAWLLSGASMAGALAGSYLNPFLPRSLFGLLLGVVSVGIGGLIVVREVRGLRPRTVLDPASAGGRTVVGAIGLLIGLLGALLGVGGPVLAVPALVVLGVPILAAVAVAQVQSVFVAGFATIGYVAQGAVSWPLALLVGVPQLAGAVGGWWIARRTEPGRLKVVLGVALGAVGFYLIL